MVDKRKIKNNKRINYDELIINIKRSHGFRIGDNFTIIYKYKEGDIIEHICNKFDVVCSGLLSGGAILFTLTEINKETQ